MYCNYEYTGILYTLENNEISEKLQKKKIGKSKYFHGEIFCMLKQF